VNGGGVAEGDVKLSDIDAEYRATLASKAGNSISIWGDPHVTVTVDGKTEGFNIGYGAGSIKLDNGSTVSWETYPVGDAKQKLLKGFSVDSAGDAFDRSINTSDGTNSKDLSTALNDTQLREFATKLRAYEGDWAAPLTVKTPAQK